MHIYIYLCIYTYNVDIVYVYMIHNICYINYMMHDICIFHDIYYIFQYLNIFNTVSILHRISQMWKNCVIRDI